MLITDIITGTLTLAFSLHRHIQDKPLLPSKKPPFVTFNHARDPNSRINHSCLPNSHHWWNSEEGEKVLFCTENMQVGWTHFCIRPYLDLKGPNRVVFPVTEKRVMYQLTLNFLWSVICHPVFATQYRLSDILYPIPYICYPISNIQYHMPVQINNAVIFQGWGGDYNFLHEPLQPGALLAIQVVKHC